MVRRCITFLLFAFATAHGRAENLTVAVAASLQYVFDDLTAAFQRESGHTVKAVYNSSGRLSAHVMHGAPFDIFLSADMEYPQQLSRQGLTAGAPLVYARGALVVWTLAELDPKQWQALLRSGRVGVIALANPKTAPYGREAMNALRYYGLDKPPRAKMVFGESIAQTNQYIYSKSADFGFTAKSVVLAAEMKGHGRWMELPHESYTPIAHGVVLLKHGLHNAPNASRDFIRFIRSPAARQILKNYGYR